MGGFGDDLSTDLGPVTTTGSYTFSGPTLNVATTIDTDGVETFRATVSETATASLSLDGNSTSGSSEKTLIDHAFNADIVLGGIVVPVVTKVEAGVGVDAELGLAFHGSVGVNGGLETGTSWDRTSGWSLVKSQSVQFSWEPPTVPAVSGHVRGYPFVTLTPAIGFSYGVGPATVALWCGPYVKVEPLFLELGLDTSADPWAWLDAGVSVSGGANCSFAKEPVELASVELIRHRLWSARSPLVSPTPAPTATPQPSPSPNPSGVADSVSHLMGQMTAPNVLTISFDYVTSGKFGSPTSVLPYPGACNVPAGSKYGWWVHFLDPTALEPGAGHITVRVVYMPMDVFTTTPLDCTTISIRFCTATVCFDPVNPSTQASSVWTPSGRDWLNYTIEAGDTFNGIAAKFGVIPDELAWGNPAVTDRNAIYIGEVLRIPPE